MTVNESVPLKKFSPTRSFKKKVVRRGTAFHVGDTPAQVIIYLHTLCKINYLFP